MKSFFSKLTKKLSNVAEISEDTLNSFREKVEGLDSNLQYRDFKNRIVNNNFSEIKTDLENAISSEVALNGRNLYLTDLKECFNNVNSLLDGAMLEKQTLVEQIYNVFTSFLLFGFLYENDYFKPLARKRSQLIYRDEYGDLNIDHWFNELERFAEKHVYRVNCYIEAHTTHESRTRYLPYGKHLNLLYNDDGFGILDHSIDFALERFIENEDSAPTEDLSSIIDPYDYEKAIAEAISKLGAEARVTQGSGDQGADVIADYAGENYIIQCKLYSRPVGNKAVQEVAAAKQFYEGDYAIVITNNSFTKSARMLAEKLGVVLLHHSQITDVFGESDTNSVTVAYDEDDLYESMMESLRSPETERLKQHASEFLSIFEPAVSENMFVFDIEDCSSYVACFASHDDYVFRTYIDYLFKLTDELSYDEKILFTLNDVKEDTLEYAENLDIRLFTDEKILDYLQELIDIHIDEE
ncbi:restriction endonuclease [Alteromonas sp. BMJM2]|uniref:restriction endonuclease n=1 Tax=Alteromonas sp. BMJM2 TaxID=2954241 RepID=UPI0022B53779|nr:restriction endonuclease [Alteromonas sp. BMJM2]